MQAQRAGRWWLAVMALTLITAGSFFAWRMWLSYQKTAVSRSWIPLPCHIDSSRIISERQTPHSTLTHRVEILYSYDLASQHYVSSRIRHVEAAPTAHLDKVQPLQQEYPPGTTQTCYVNPAAPHEAVLQRGSRAALFSIWFPLLFVVGGGGMLIGALHTRRSISPP
jgi:Protein of unknown function (DUF3592)